MLNHQGRADVAAPRPAEIVAMRAAVGASMGPAVGAAMRPSVRSPMRAAVSPPVGAAMRSTYQCHVISPDPCYLAACPTRLSIGDGRPNSEQSRNGPAHSRFHFDLRP